jgi:hypothetical protein
VHELIAPEGATYVLQAYCVGVDPTIEQPSLHTLRGWLALSQDWSYRSRVLQDELQHTYTLVG